MSVSEEFASELRDHADGSESWFRRNLRTLVEIPSVSPGGQQAADVRACAVAARDLIREAGGQAELVETSGTPSVVGGFTHPEARTKVLVYNHLDVQPANAADWSTSDPFSMGTESDAERGFVYRGRGTTDDKGPALAALRAASYVAARRLPVSVSFIWETEEEIGSPHFREAVTTRREELGCDCVIVSDTIWPAAGKPAITVGLRGMLQAVLRLETAAKQAHSGLAGGVARNPVRELCALATAIESARFWRQGVTTPEKAEIDGFLAAGFDPEYFRRAQGLDLLETDVPLDMMLRLWARPTFEVHGLAGGYTGPGVMTVVPNAAELKTSFRLVPDQDPGRIADELLAFVAAENPDVEVEALASLRPYKMDTTGPVHGAIREALRATFGREPALIREGGSIGAVPVLIEELGVPVHFLPLSLPEHGYHAPDECFDWRQARGGIEAFVRTFALLAGG